MLCHLPGDNYWIARKTLQNSHTSCLLCMKCHRFTYLNNSTCPHIFIFVYDLNSKLAQHGQQNKSSNSKSFAPFSSPSIKCTVTPFTFLGVLLPHQTNFVLPRLTFHLLRIQRSFFGSCLLSLVWPQGSCYLVKVELRLLWKGFSGNLYSSTIFILWSFPKCFDFYYYDSYLFYY